VTRKVACACGAFFAPLQPYGTRTIVTVARDRAIDLLLVTRQ
jgi:hypothetical protein